MERLDPVPKTSVNFVTNWKMPKIYLNSLGHDKINLYLWSLNQIHHKLNHGSQRYKINNRPSVAVAVLQTALSFTDWFIESLIRSSFFSQFSRHQKSQTVRARELKFWENVPPPKMRGMLRVRCQMSHVRCQVSPDTRCQVSGVSCQV